MQGDINRLVAKGGKKATPKKKAISQSLVFTITHEGFGVGQVKQTVNLTFEPGLAGEDLFKKLSKPEKQLQHTASHLASVIMEALGDYQ